MKKTILASALMTLSFAASAAPITYFAEDPTTSGVLGVNSANARADFLSNLTGVANEDFEGFALGTSSPINLSFPGSSGTIQATLSGNGSIDNSGPGRFATSGTKFWETSTGSFKIDFSSGVNAFGFNGIDIGDFVTAQMTLGLEGGGSETLTVPHSLGLGNNDKATLFFGFIDTDVSYTSVEFFNIGGGDIFAFDDMIIGDVGQVTSVPAPISVAFLGLGLLGMAASRRRK